MVVPKRRRKLVRLIGAGEGLMGALGLERGGICWMGPIKAAFRNALCGIERGPSLM